MKSFKQFLIEMPINNFQLKGQWGKDAKRKYGYDSKSSGILENPKGIEKIHRLWSNSKQDFDFYFLRSSKAYKHVEVGMVEPEWVKENLDLDIKPNDNITVIFTNNNAADRQPLNSWTIGHRLGHAIARTEEYNYYFQKAIETDFKQILKSVYGLDSKLHVSYSDFDKQLKALASALGTMKSARDGTLRNFNEFLHELLAQYLITGKITFNNLTRSLILRKRFAWGNPSNLTKYYIISDEELEQWNDTIQYYSKKYEDGLDQLLSSFNGSIFVM